MGDSKLESFFEIRGMAKEGWNTLWEGMALGRAAAIFEHTTPEGGEYLIILGPYESGCGSPFGHPQIEHYQIQKLGPFASGGIASHIQKRTSTYYHGRRPAEVLGSGLDLLGDEILMAGEPNYESIVDVLPPVSEGNYGILGSPASWGKFIMMPNGDVMTQDKWAFRGESVRVFSPAEEYASMTNTSHDLAGENGSERHLPPLSRQGLLDDWMPVILSRFAGPDEVVDVVTFISPSDFRRDPALKVGMFAYDSSGGAPKWSHLVSFVRTGGLVKRVAASEDHFYESFVSAVIYWQKFKERLADIATPDPCVSRWFKGTLAMATTVFSGDHPHYGTRGYGGEFHDSFPPNYLTSIETFFACGDVTRARRILEHLLSYGIDDAGRFVYRRGPTETEDPGASGTEYGQFLWLLNRIESQLGPRGWLEPYMDRIEAVGQYLRSNRKPVQEAGGRRLILLCAEADTKERVHPYLGNSLWAVRGFRALGEFLDRYGWHDKAQLFLREADELLQETKAALDAAEEPTDYGRLVPFRFDYPALPWTLSFYDARPEGVSPERFSEYLASWGYG